MKKILLVLAVLASSSAFASNHLNIECKAKYLDWKVGMSSKQEGTILPHPIMAEKYQEGAWLPFENAKFGIFNVDIEISQNMLSIDVFDSTNKVSTLDSRTNSPIPDKNLGTIVSQSYTVKAANGSTSKTLEVTCSEK